MELNSRHGFSNLGSVRIRVVFGQDHNTSHLVPSWQDVDMMESIDNVTKPLQDITDLSHLLSC